MSDSRLRQLWSKFNLSIVQASLNRLLVVHAACLLHRRVRLAVDLTLVPYHGKPKKRERKVYRGPAKSGTSHFHAYATAYVIPAAVNARSALVSLTEACADAEALAEMMKKDAEGAR